LAWLQTTAPIFKDTCNLFARMRNTQIGRNFTRQPKALGKIGGVKEAATGAKMNR
jgi:hypothetical protein